MQVLVKLSPDTMATAYAVSCGSREEREAYVKSAAVWWYAYPEDDDMLWRQGGAWAAVLEPEPEALEAIDRLTGTSYPGGTPYPGRVTGEEDDDVW